MESATTGPVDLLQKGGGGLSRLYIDRDSSPIIRWELSKMSLTFVFSITPLHVDLHRIIVPSPNVPVSKTHRQYFSTLLEPNMFFFLGLIASKTPAVAADDQYACYYPDGSVSPKSYACNVTAVQNGEHSPCCFANDMCFDSGACYQGWSGVMYRHSCTDPKFLSPACPRWCLEQGP